MWDFFTQKMRVFGEPAAAVRVLRFVRERGTTSQIEVARSCGLSKAAVSEVVQRLTADGYLQELGMSSSTKNGGRRRVLLQFNALSGLVVGIDIRISSAQVALSDLNATILSRKEVHFTKGASPGVVIPRLIEAVDELLRNKPDTAGTLIGIGIGVPGVIDYTTGTLIVADTLRGWDGISLSGAFESRFEVPVYVENDVKSMTVAEYLLGVAKGVRDFVLLWLGSGIGAGIMVDGRLLRGATSSAGEIGYNNLGFLICQKGEFPLLYAGQKDFGDILSEDSIIDAYRRMSGRSDPELITLAEILDRAANGEAGAMDIFHEFSRLIGAIGIMLANTLNPEMIVLGGAVIDSSLQIGDEVAASLKNDILPAAVQSVRVEHARYKSDEVLLGAIGLILYELFEPQSPLLRSKLEDHARSARRRTAGKAAKR